jgi:hypothetical protein
VFCLLNQVVIIRHIREPRNRQKCTCYRPDMALLSQFSALFCARGRVRNKVLNFSYNSPPSQACCA